MARNVLLLSLVWCLCGMAHALDRKPDEALFVVGKEHKVRGLVRIEGDQFKIRKPDQPFEYVMVPVASVTAWCWLNPEICKKDPEAALKQLQAVLTALPDGAPMAIEVGELLVAVEAEIKRKKEDAETLTLDEIKAIVDKRLAAFKSDADAKRDARERMVLDEIPDSSGAKLSADLKLFKSGLSVDGYPALFGLEYGSAVNSPSRVCANRTIRLYIFSTESERSSVAAGKIEGAVIIGFAGTWVNRHTGYYQAGSTDKPISKCFIYAGTEAFVRELKSSCQYIMPWV